MENVHFSSLNSVTQKAIRPHKQLIESYAYRFLEHYNNHIFIFEWTSPLTSAIY